MTLQAGSRLGPYEILAPLGAGGMDKAPDPIVVVLDWTAGLAPPGR